MFNADPPRRAELPEHGPAGCRSTTIAAAVAAVLLMLRRPAGRVRDRPDGRRPQMLLGLTQMGEIKYDTHGDPPNAPKDFYHGYGKGRGETAQAGTLQAAFDGTHGWFWRNRSKAEVTVTLKTSGDYESIKRVL
jgi:hypothetical protein